MFECNDSRSLATPYVFASLCRRLRQRPPLSVADRGLRRLLSQADDDFVHTVADELQIFIGCNDNRDVPSVLVFPPVSNYRRFLIHKTAEGIADHDLATFSIGQGDDRRTVVCYGHQIVSKRNKDRAEKMVVENRQDAAGKFAKKRNTSGDSDSGVYRPPQIRMQQNQTPHRENPVRIRRPDRAVYVPKPRRVNTTVSSTSITTTNVETTSIPTSSPANIECQRTFPPKITKDQKTLSPKTKRSHDKNFCNVYKPPPARLNNLCSSENSSLRNLSVQDIQLNFSESLPRTKVHDYVTQACQNVTLDSIVPSSENSQLPSSNCCRKECEQIDQNLDNSSLANDLNLPKTKTLYVEDVVNSLTPLDPGVGCLNNTSSYTSEHVDNNSEDLVNDKIVVNEQSIEIHDLVMENQNVCQQHIVSDVAEEYSIPSSELILNHDVPSQKDEDDDSDQKELIKASEEINRSNRRLIKQSYVSDVLVISDPAEEKTEALHEEIISKENSEEAENENNCSKQNTNRKKTKMFNPEEEDWDAMFDENGEWLEPKLIDEITATVGQVQLQKPRMSYSNYINNAPQAFAHVLEVYNFPSEFTTNDLFSVFSDFKDTGFEIKWVDDNHALAVFSSTEIAAQVLAYNHPMVKTRPLHEATHESRAKAKKSAEFLRPYKARPETCTAHLRRLVSGALGVKLPNQEQERKEEKEKISLAREKKRLTAMHREAAWNGSLTSDM